VLSNTTILLATAALAITVVGVLVVQRLRKARDTFELIVSPHPKKVADLKDVSAKIIQFPTGKEVNK